MTGSSAPYQTCSRRHGSRTIAQEESIMPNEQIPITAAIKSAVLKVLTREELQAELKSREHVSDRKRRGPYLCPQGCGSLLRTVREGRFHKCEGPPKKEDRSAHWEMVSSGTGYPEWPFDEGFPWSPYAKCEIILCNGEHHTAWIEESESGRRWNAYGFKIREVEARDVAAWKVLEHFA